MSSNNTYSSINEFAVAGEFGYQRVPGPFEVEAAGTVWGIIVPEDAHKTVSRLQATAEGEAAVLIADGQTVAGGIVTDVVEKPDCGEVHVLVNQYAMGEEEE